MLRIVEPIASQGISGKGAVFQTGIIVNPLAQEKFVGSTSTSAAYTCRRAVRWPSGRRRRFAKVARDQRTGLKLTISGPFFIGSLVGVGCRLMDFGPGLGTLEPMPVCASWAHIEGRSRADPPAPCRLQYVALQLQCTHWRSLRGRSDHRPSARTVGSHAPANIPPPRTEAFGRRPYGA